MRFSNLEEQELLALRLALYYYLDRQVGSHEMRATAQQLLDEITEQHSFYKRLIYRADEEKLSQ